MHTFIFKKLRRDQIPLLYKWAQFAHIAQWWDWPSDWQEFEKKYTTALQSPARGCFFAYLNDRPIGYTQWYIANRFGQWEYFPDTVFGIDFLIGDQHFIGKGYGTKLVQEFVQFVFKTTNAQTIISDPNTENQKAVKCLTNAGFYLHSEFLQHGINYMLMKIDKIYLQ